MIETVAIRKKITIVKKKLLNMLKLPEKWESVYLYASVIVHPNKLETGEMFFYYIPKGIVAKNPVNVYEIPERFDIYEDSYLKLAEDLYDSIKDLRKEIILNGDKPWTNITLSIVKDVLRIEFKYDDLLNSEYTSYERHLIWRYEYLDMPLNSYNRKEKRLISNYMKLNNNNNLLTAKADIYQENLYEKDDKNLNENYEKAKELVEKEKIRKLTKMNENTNESEKHKKKHEHNNSNLNNQLIPVSKSKIKIKEQKKEKDEKPKVLNDYLSVRQKEIEKETMKKQKRLENIRISRNRVKKSYYESQGLTVLMTEEKEKNTKQKHKLNIENEFDTSNEIKVNNNTIKIIKRLNNDEDIKKVKTKTELSHKPIKQNENKINRIVKENKISSNVISVNNRNSIKKVRRRKKLQVENKNDEFKLNKVHIIFNDIDNDIDNKKNSNVYNKISTKNLINNDIENVSYDLSCEAIKNRQECINSLNKVHIILDSSVEDEERILRTKKKKMVEEELSNNIRLNNVSSIDKKIVRKKRKPRTFSVDDDFEDAKGQNQILNFDDQK